MNLTFGVTLFGVIAESVPNRTLSVRMPVYATLAKNPHGGRPHKSLFFLAPYKAVFPWPETLVFGHGPGLGLQASEL